MACSNDQSVDSAVETSESTSSRDREGAVASCVAPRLKSRLVKELGGLADFPAVDWLLLVATA
jgi:hypothetical protein